MLYPLSYGGCASITTASLRRRSFNHLPREVQNAFWEPMSWRLPGERSSRRSRIVKPNIPCRVHSSATTDDRRASVLRQT